MSTLLPPFHDAGDGRTGTGNEVGVEWNEAVTHRRRTLLARFGCTAGRRRSRRWSDRAGKRQGRTGGCWDTYIVVAALLLECLLGEDVSGTKEGERGRALGDHRSPDERGTARDRSVQHFFRVPHDNLRRAGDAGEVFKTVDTYLNA